MVDLSGSMSGEIANLKTGINNDIITAVLAVIPNAAFGLVTFADWEAMPYQLNQPFLYTINPDGSGLSAQIAGAVLDLTSNLKMDVTTQTETVVHPELADTTRFIKAVTPAFAQPPGGVDGLDSISFFGVEAGTLVTFTVDFHNDFFEPATDVATLFQATIYVIGEGATVLSSREVYIIVPGEGGEVIVN